MGIDQRLGSAGLCLTAGQSNSTSGIPISCKQFSSAHGVGNQVQAVPGTIEPSKADCSGAHRPGREAPYPGAMLTRSPNSSPQLLKEQLACAPLALLYMEKFCIAGLYLFCQTCF